MADNATKRDAMLEVLGTGVAAVMLDPRREGVRVPERLKNQPVLILNWAHGFKIPSFTVDDEGIYGFLSFGTTEKVACNVPWEAVFGIIAAEAPNRDGSCFWFEDAPAEEVIRVTESLERMNAHPQEPPVPAAAETPAKPVQPLTSVPSRGHLRVVK